MRSRPAVRRWAGYPIGLVGVGAVTAGLALASDRVNVISLAVCYQLLVLVVSGAFGAGAGLVAGLASVAAFNWFFLPPVHTFTIVDSRNWVSFGVFAATALITSQLAAGFRRQRAEAEQRRRDADLLAGLARSALADIGSPGHVDAVAEAAASALGVRRCAVVLADASASAAALRAPADRGTFAIPLLSRDRNLGVLEVSLPDADPERRWARPEFAAAVAGLVALAVERDRLLAQALEAESLRRSDEIKTALLRTVSHEFRSPLTAVRTAGEALAQESSPSGAEALLGVIRTETERLERLVANLLDLSRLEAGAMVARLDWCDPIELCTGAIAAAEPLLDGRAVISELPADLPLVRADAPFCERILVNLLHNAARHGAPPIVLAAGVSADRLELAVQDGGHDLDPAVAARLFTAFARSRTSGGTGIGLAIARGLAEAQGGTLELDRAGPSTRFVLTLPLVPVPEVV